ncbi:hypothetical protein BMS3Bbin04_00310 [bacterium BMS3Bbin04]|nr:hypothetical protein BMS3Bbin04_00310 [bacterium BMS3Bbin04]
MPGKCTSGVFRGQCSDGCQRISERAHRPCYEDICSFRSATSGDFRTSDVDFLATISETELTQFMGISTKGICFDELSTGLNVLPMHSFHQVRFAEIERVEIAVDVDTAFVQTGTHRTVAQYHSSRLQPTE